MRMPVPFRLLVDAGSSPMVVSGQLPAPFSHRVFISHPTHTSVGENHFIVQAYSGSTYSFALWTFTVKDAPSLRVAVSRCFMALVICLQGTCRINVTQYFDKTQSYQLVYIPRGVHTLSVSKGELVLLILVPPADAIREMAMENRTVRPLYNRFQYESRSFDSLRALPIGRRVVRYCRKLFNNKEKGTLLDYQVSTILLELLGLYHQQLLQDSHQQVYTDMRDQILVEQVLVYISTHVETDGIGQTNLIAKRFHREVSALRKVFKQFTGMSMQDYIREERLLRARRLLQSGQATVSEVAYQVGYTAVSNFVRAYKKLFGHTPGHG